MSLMIILLKGTNKTRIGTFSYNFYQGQTIENGSNTPIVVAKSLAHGLYIEEVVQVASKAYQIFYAHQTSYNCTHIKFSYA